MKKEDVQKRAVKVSIYMIVTKSTVRNVANYFNISKSTVYKDVTERVNKTRPDLGREVEKVLEFNKKERSVRGGIATKRKYEQLKK